MNRIIFLLLILLCAASAQAQEETLTKTVEVSRAYEPTVPEAYKINPIPRIDDSSQVAATFTYPLRQTKPLTDAYLINPIPPARIQREQYDEADEGNRGYVRVGLGVKAASLLDAYYGSERSKNFVWDVFANHYGSYGKVKNEAKEKVPNLDMRNEIGGSGQYNFKRGLLYGRAGFHRHDVRYYGYETEFFTLDDYKAMPKNDKQQAYNRTYFSLGYSSFNLPDTSWSFGGTFNFYDYRSRMKQAEDALEFKLFANKKITPTTTLGLTVNTDAYLRNEELADHNNTVVSFMPEAVERRENWQATAKFNLTFDNFSGKVKPYFYPVLNFTALLADNMFCPYVEVSGEHGVNTYKSLSAENPYLSPYMFFMQELTDGYGHLRNTQQAISLQGGAKGHVGSMFGYNVGLSYGLVNDMYFFITDRYLLNFPNDGQLYNVGNHFAVLYDDVKLFTFTGNLRFQPSRALEFSFAMRYDKYAMDKLTEAYNRPSLRMKVGATYNLWSKLNLYANASYMGDYKTLPSVDEHGTLLNDGKHKAGVDLSLGADYTFYDRSSVFLQLNNLTNNRYHVYSTYPSYGINVMLGYTRVF